MRRFLADKSAASAAEFALVLPIFLIFLVGIIDVGLYSWSLNRVEKATQIGTRYAVATDLVPSGLANYSFATSGTPLIPQGETVPQSRFPDIVCTGAGTISCTGSFGAANPTAFTNIVNRMRQIDGRIQNSNVRIVYSWSGLGFSGDPNGPDVAPIVTVSVNDPAISDANKVKFTPITGLIFGAAINLPALTYSLTSEDGEGSVSN